MNTTDAEKSIIDSISGADLSYLLRKLDRSGENSGDAEPPLTHLSLIKALQNALVEVLTQNVELKESIQELEQKVTQLEADCTAKD